MGVLISGLLSLIFSSTLNKKTIEFNVIYCDFILPHYQYFHYFLSFYLSLLLLFAFFEKKRHIMRR